MKNPNIARVLKYYRKMNEISVNDVSNILKENNNYAAPKTIYVWETFGYQGGSESKPLLLSPKERKLITNYREQKVMQPAVDRLLGLTEED